MTPNAAPLDRFIFTTLLPWWQSGHPWPDMPGWREWPMESLVVVGWLAFMALVFWRMNATAKQASAAQHPKERKHRETPTFERFLTWLWPPPEPTAFGHIVCSFKHIVHMIVFGAPGSGKSTFMYNRIIEPAVGIWAVLRFFTWGLLPRRARRGKLIITGNLSKPFRVAIIWLIKHGWPAYIWTPNPVAGEGFGLDLTEGPPENLAERFIAVQPVSAGNTGLRSGAVEGMIVDACHELQHLKIERGFATILAILPAMGKRPLLPSGKPDFTQPPQPLSPNERAGLEDWSTRIRTITRRLGASVGHDVRLSEVLAKGQAILIEGSSYNNPNSIEPLMLWMVYMVMWLVGEIGHFDVIIDEPGAVGPGTFTKLLTATRAPDVRITIGMQSRKQVDDTLREMCGTVLLCGAAGDAPEAREFESRCTDGDIPPEDFVLLEPRRWYEWLLLFWPRRGLYALEAYLFSNGRLDKVRTKPCDLSILKGWPTGSIPCIPEHLRADYHAAEQANISSILNGAGTLATGSGMAENGTGAARANEAGVVLAGEAGAARPRDLSGQKPKWVVDGDVVRERHYRKMRREMEMPHIKLGCLRWLGGDNGQGRPKTHLTVRRADGAKRKTTPTTYVVTFEWEHGPGSAQPSLDHLCHTNDQTCPGNDLCENPTCQNPMHPYGEPCQHNWCCETSHAEPVPLPENQRRNGEQKQRYRAWLERFKAEQQLVEARA